jgi:hypothetical protein
MAFGYLPNRSSTGILKNRPLLIGLGKLVATTIKIKRSKALRRFLMPSRNESMRARERLESATPISDDANLLKLDEEAAEYLRKVRRRNALGTDELISTVVDEVARNYFQYILRKQARVTPVQRRTRA